MNFYVSADNGVTHTLYGTMQPTWSAGSSGHVNAKIGFSKTVNTLMTATAPPLNAGAAQIFGITSGAIVPSNTNAVRVDVPLGTVYGSCVYG